MSLLNWLFRRKKRAPKDPTPQIVELGFFIGLTMGQQRWNRLINMGHGQFMGGTTGGLSPTSAQATQMTAPTA